MLEYTREIEKFSAQIIYYSHFGFSNKVQEHINRTREQLMTWDSIVKSSIKEGASKDVSKRLISQASAELAPMKVVISLKPLYEYLIDVHIPLCAAGHTKYYQEALTVTIS